MTVTALIERLPPDCRLIPIALEHRRSPQGVSLVYALCQCLCGSPKKWVLASKLTSTRPRTRVISCGCLRNEKMAARIKHGLGETLIYRVWSNMVRRCHNPKAQMYAFYGAKGVSVCHEWRHDIGAFATWAIQNGYEKGKVIDRIDSRGNYEPGNVRFVTDSESRRNTTRTAFTTLPDGRKVKIIDLYDQLKPDVGYQKFSRRIRSGLSIDEACRS